MSKDGFKDIDIMATDPMKEQFEPTEAQPIRQRARMAGDPQVGYVPQNVITPLRTRTLSSKPAPRRGPAKSRSRASRPSSTSLRRY